LQEANKLARDATVDAMVRYWSNYASCCRQLIADMTGTSFAGRPRGAQTDGEPK
jgi:hypothetical protein